MFRWVLALATITGYVVYVVHRIRKRRRRDDAAAERTRAAELSVEERLARTLETAARLTGEPPNVPPTAAPAPLGREAEPPTVPGAVPPLLPSVPPSLVSTPGITIAELLRGIVLPHDLAPLTTMAPRVGAVDRVAFWTDTATADVVGPAFLDALRGIGAQVTQLTADQYAIERDGHRAMVALHPDGQAVMIDGQPGYPSVPVNAFVAEVWL